MGSEVASMFTISNKACKSDSCPGFLIVDKDGIVRSINETCNHFSTVYCTLREGDNVCTSPLAPYFCTHAKCHTCDDVADSEILIEDGIEDSEWWLGTLLKSLEVKKITTPKWNQKTEKLIQQISLRNAHEILNALTPVYGIIHMLKEGSDNKLGNKKLKLLKLAQQEITKAKNYVNDFLMLNFETIPKPNWISIVNLKEFIETKLNKQAPEFIPHLKFNIIGDKEKMVFLDKRELRLILQLIVKKWIDYAGELTIIRIDFNTNNPGRFRVNMTVPEENDSLNYIDDEFDFYLHLIERNVIRNKGIMRIKDGIIFDFKTGDYPNTVGLKT